MTQDAIWAGFPEDNKAQYLALLNWLRTADKAAVGDLLAEYITEGNHGSWDGWAPEQVAVIWDLFADVNRYRIARGPFTK